MTLLPLLKKYNLLVKHQANFDKDLAPEVLPGT